MKVFIEKARFYHYFFIKNYIKKGYKVYIFYFDYKKIRKRWLRGLIDNGLVYKILPNFIRESHLLALDNVEGVYKSLFSNSRLKNSMVRIFGDRNIELFYKKALLEELCNFYAVHIAIRDSLEDKKNEGVLLVPGKYFSILKMVKKTKAKFFEFSNIKVPYWANCVNYINAVFYKIFWSLIFWFLTPFLAAIAFFKIIISFGKRLRKYDYAITILNAAYQLKKNCNFDFLLDHRLIRKDNTIFLLLSFLKKSVINKLKLDEYNIVKCKVKDVICSKRYFLSAGDGINIIKNVIWYWISNGVTMLFENNFLIFNSNILLVEYFRWRVILSNYKFNNYITFNDENIRHISRNILLKKNSCKTWFYAHSASFSYLMTSKSSEMIEYRHQLWSYLFYDCYLGVNKSSIDYQKLHMQKVSNYFNIGCIWSAFIFNNKAGSARSILNDESTNKVILDKYKIIAVFDTSYPEGSNSDFSLRDGIKFYSDILKLLDDNPDYFVVAKEKKPEYLYSQRKFSTYSSLNSEYTDILKKIKSHPRAYLPGPAGNNAEIIKISDLVITHVFSSSSIEALGARKRGIFYDPTGKFRNCYYSSVPDLFACEYEELRKLVYKILYKVSKEDFEVYLNTHIQNRVENYLDGNALGRFRKLLITDSHSV